LTATTTRDLLAAGGLQVHDDELRMTDLLYVSGHRWRPGVALPIVTQRAPDRRQIRILAVRALPASQP